MLKNKNTKKTTENKEELKTLLANLKEQSKSQTKYHLSMVELHCGKVEKSDIDYCKQLTKRMEKKFKEDFKNGLLVYA
jgi:hypothetical protein